MRKSMFSDRAAVVVLLGFLAFSTSQLATAKHYDDVPVTPSTGIVKTAAHVVDAVVVEGESIGEYTNQILYSNSVESNQSEESSDVIVSPELTECTELESTEPDTQPREVSQSEVESSADVITPIACPVNFRSAGVLQDSDWRYTYYSSRVLYHYRTPEWTVGSDGIYRDSDGYVVVASSDLSEGSTFCSEIFGYCKVYDCGCPSGTIDVYVNF